VAVSSESLLDSTTYRLFGTLQDHRAAMSRVLRGLGLYPGQELCLAQLWREDGLSLSELATRMRVSSANTTKVTRSLERAGLVVRRSRADGAKVIRVHLTDAGRALRSPVTRAWYQAETNLLRNLTTTQRVTLDICLARGHADNTPLI
jgi:MarR family transcriptional regulator, organic hydroperoxide resistance regulator